MKAWYTEMEILVIVETVDNKCRYSQSSAFPALGGTSLMHEVHN